MEDAEARCPGVFRFSAQSFRSAQCASRELHLDPLGVRHQPALRPGIACEAARDPAPEASLAALGDLVTSRLMNDAARLSADDAALVCELEGIREAGGDLKPSNVLLAADGMRWAPSFMKHLAERCPPMASARRLSG